MGQAVKVTNVISTQHDAFNGLSKSYVALESGLVTQTAYLFHKPENTPKVGDEYTGTFANDKRGDIKFTKDRLERAPTPTTRTPTSTRGLAPKPPERTFKADPDKMQQDFNLTRATNMSIQRQVAVKGAVDLITAGKLDYEDLYSAYTAIMELLSEPDWHKFEGRSLDRVPTSDDLDEDIDEILETLAGERDGDD